MSDIYLIYSLGLLALLLVTLIFSVSLFVKGREVMRHKRWWRLYLLIIVLSLFEIIAIQGISTYRYHKTNEEIEKIAIESDSAYKIILDTANDNISRYKAITELKLKNDRLISLTKDLSENALIIGKEPYSTNRINVIIDKNKGIINHLSSYNEILNLSDYQYALKDGYKFSGETSKFTFIYPKSTSGKYIDFGLFFNDDKIVEKIAVIYINVFQRNKDGSVVDIYSCLYKPQKDINMFRLKNYFTNDNIYMNVGFFWKSEFGKIKTPTYEKITFSPPK